MDRVIVLGAGGPAGAAFSRCFNLMDVVGIDTNTLALNFSPGALAVHQDNENTSLVDTLNSIEAGFVHAQPDPEVLRLTEIKDEIHHKTLLPDLETIAICQDKLHTWHHLPKDFRPKPRDEGKFPFWIRATRGTGANMAAKADYSEALQYHQMEIAHAGHKFMVSEYLPGKNYGVDLVYINGLMVGHHVKERISYTLTPGNNGTGGSASIVESIRNPDILEIANLAVWSVSKLPNGVFSVDLKENSDSEPKVTEINPGRFLTSSLVLFHLTGYNLPALYHEVAKGNAPPTFKYPEGAKVLRTMDSKPILLV
jgi:predicted ATP-grasp superfamily ATP-dependent carboligase